MKWRKIVDFLETCALILVIWCIWTKSNLIFWDPLFCKKLMLNRGVSSFLLRWWCSVFLSFFYSWTNSFSWYWIWFEKPFHFCNFFLSRRISYKISLLSYFCISPFSINISFLIRENSFLSLIVLSHFHKIGRLLIGIHLTLFMKFCYFIPHFH